MLVTLSLVFCLGVHCETVRPAPSEASMGLAACQIEGQQLAAQWLEEHPKWVLDRVRCAPGNPAREDDI